MIQQHNLQPAGLSRNTLARVTYAGPVGLTLRNRTSLLGVAGGGCGFDLEDALAVLCIVGVPRGCVWRFVRVCVGPHCAVEV